MNKLLLILSCIVAVISDMSYVMYAKENNHPLKYLAIGVVGSIVSISIWLYTMKNGIESSMAITYYCLLTMAGCTALGFLVFHEQLSVINFVGIILAIIALILISI